MLPRLRNGLLVLLAIVVTTGCATRGATPRPFPMPATRAAAPDEAAPPVSAAAGRAADSRLADGLPVTGHVIAENALQYRGTPYRFGGADPDDGFDCSGLVQYVYASHGITMPRDVASQYRAGWSLVEDIQPGDLLFFDTEGGGASHVGIAINPRQFVHAPKENGVVRVEGLGSSYWGPRYLGARRVLHDGRDHIAVY